MLKWVAAVLLLVFLGLCTLTYLSGVAWREASFVESKILLKLAAKDFAELGYVTNVSSTTYRFSLSTNVVTIRSTQYHCFAEIGGGAFRDEGKLAVTTNDIFIWLDARRPPKIIGPDYRPPLFPPSF